uniref:Uncharacterized protein n=1 Tax=Anopheles dirus TaxID=7168 RepID=A0A182NAI5_9DIPT
MLELELDEEASVRGSMIEKTEAWLRETDRVGSTPHTRRDGGREGQRPMTPDTTDGKEAVGGACQTPAKKNSGGDKIPWRPSQPPTPGSSGVPPSYDRTWKIDQEAALEREYTEWRRAMEESITQHRERQCKNENSIKENANGGKEMVGVIGEFPLTPSQKAAREATSRELPVFTGAIEQWPLFIASYERSTKTCGFTEEENLLRLQKALKGPALDSVDHLLYFPEGLSEAMDILRTEYGRPELIVESLVDKVKRMPPPRADKLETIAAFGKAVRKMCGTIRISGLQEYNCNVTLLKELSAKLPPERRLEWARFKVDLPRVTVDDFGSWIWEIGHAASRETNPFAMPREFDVANQHNVQQRSAPQRSSLQYGAPQRSSLQHSAPQRKPHNAYMNTHNAEPKRERRCTLCHDTCASLADYVWHETGRIREGVARRGLCTTCLYAHKGKCFIKTVCGVDGCLLRHHALLHQTIPATHTTQLEHCNTHASNNKDTLLRYVPVIISGNGKQ